MKARWRWLLFWTPRVGSLLFVSFMSIFALDVFDAGYSFWETVLALLIHLTPVGVLLGGTWVAWRQAWTGALFFAGWVAWYLVTFWEMFPLSVYLIFAGVPAALGVLFLLSWWWPPESWQQVGSHG
ncbi:MAG: hypothetical protein HY329_03830 [Chloroflexi bacterium]|nr:hypothetical protein [Chloroflexota bacterium]